MGDFTPHQQKIIKRYYDNMDTIKLQRLAELAGELYLSNGKKLAKAWEQTEAAMKQLGLPQARIDHLITQKKPELIAELVKELDRK